jgi:hypothetical protein
MVKKRKKILVFVVLYFFSVFASRIYMTFRCIDCYCRMHGIATHISAYESADDGIRLSTLEEVRQITGLDADTFVCQISNKEYAYFPEAKNDDDVLLCDSTPSHQVIRSGIIGYFDFFTFRLFAPKGRIIMSNDLVEGFLPETEFQKKIASQRGDKI